MLTNFPSEKEIRDMLLPHFIGEKDEIQTKQSEND